MKKGLKRQISTFACAVAVLIWTCAPAQSEYAGRLQRGSYVLRVQDLGGGTAVTVIEVTRGRLDVIDIHTVAGGTTVDIPYTTSTKAERLIIVIDPVSDSSEQVNLTILDSNNVVVVPQKTYTTVHAEVVFDITP